MALEESIATVIPAPAFAGTGFAGIHNYHHSRTRSPPSRESITTVIPAEAGIQIY